MNETNEIDEIGKKLQIAWLAFIAIYFALLVVGFTFPELVGIIKLIMSILSIPFAFVFWAYMEFPFWKAKKELEETEQNFLKRAKEADEKDYYLKGGIA